ncbi:MAG TPA: hypothetical protein DFS52_02180 [Myxococcales bacterium]|nr:hypothetical protein [Myxococcales bacterium]
MRCDRLRVPNDRGEKHDAREPGPPHRPGPRRLRRDAASTPARRLSRRFGKLGRRRAGRHRVPGRGGRRGRGQRGRRRARCGRRRGRRGRPCGCR